MFELIEKLLPVVLIIGLGIILRERQVISFSVVNGLKQLITKVALPSVLFLSFSKSKLETKYIVIFVLVFMMCCILYGVGTWINKYYRKGFGEKFAPGFFTGFELGMVGIGLFTALWGIEHLNVIMLMGLGHEIFIWFIYVPLLEYRNTGNFNIKDTIKSFAFSPIILAIIVGIAVNIAGIYDFISGGFLGKSVIQTLSLLSQLTSPLILIVIGYSMVIKEVQIKKVIQYILTRALSVGILGVITLFLIHTFIGKVDRLFDVAFYFFLMLPPPYILPLFIKDNKEEEELFSQMLVYYTLLSFAAYIGLMLISL
ncbi:MAG: Auxin Efflux Carrier [Clostridia bacterium]|jgi:predicted permease|nr:Auxin Efflux Carrier [Clostridia bacterium]